MLREYYDAHEHAPAMRALVALTRRRLGVDKGRSVYLLALFPGLRAQPEPVDLVVCDASFISLRLVLPAALALTKAEARLVALIKPQFEVGRGEVGKGGVVRDPAAHARVCAEVEAWLGGLPGWSVDGIVESPITGPAGNREFLIGATRRPAPPP